jgi:hypothetical protein
MLFAKARKHATPYTENGRAWLGIALQAGSPQGIVPLRRPVRGACRYPNLSSATRQFHRRPLPTLAQLRQTGNSFLAYQHFVIAACCLIAVPTQIAAGWHVLSYTLIVQCSEGLSSSRRLPLRTAASARAAKAHTATRFDGQIPLTADDGFVEDAKLVTSQPECTDHVC